MEYGSSKRVRNMVMSLFPESGDPESGVGDLFSLASVKPNPRFLIAHYAKTQSKKKKKSTQAQSPIT